MTFILALIIELLGAISLVIIVTAFIQYKTGVLLNINYKFLGYKLQISGIKNREISFRFHKE